MSSCVFLPAWLSRMTWSTWARSSSRRRSRIVSGEPISSLSERRRPSGSLLPLLVALPEVVRPGLERPFLVVELEGELEEGPAVGLLLRLFVGRRAHEAADRGEVRVRLVVAELALVLREGVVVRVDPGPGGVEVGELEAQRAHAAVRGVADRVELRTGDPERRVRPLQRLRDHVAEREVEVVAVVLPAFVPEHRQAGLDRLLPDDPFVAEAAAEGMEFGDARAFAEAELDPAVRDQVERRNALRDPGRVIRRQLDDAVAEADVLRPLRRRCQEHFGRRTVGVLLQEVVLHLPGVVVPEPVREFDLLQRVLKQPVLRVRPPRLR